MAVHLQRSIFEPFREGLAWDELWLGSDRGLIWCWERGRRKRFEDPELASRADKGELVMLAWKGGVEEKLKVASKLGTLNYLATWQGLRGEDLDIERDDERVVVCARTGQAVTFTARIPVDVE